MQTTSLSIAEVLRRARDKSLTIPQFQRPFVWNDGQVKLLVDSISRNYPIGSLLLLTKSSTITLSSRSIEASLRDGFPPDSALESAAEALPNEQHYVLDGQQRLTSVVRVFMNAHPKNTYYFDVKAMVEDYNSEGTGWIKTRSRTPAPDRRDKNRLVRSDLVLDQTKADIYISEYVEDSGEFPELQGEKTKLREAAARVKGIFERIRNYQLPVVTIDRDAQIESICRIFETINSTGTRLTTFDLAVARFFPNPDLRDWWDRVREQHSILNEFDVDGERALQVVSLITAHKSGRYPEATRSELLNLSPEVLASEWEGAAAALASAYRWAHRNGARAPNPPSHGVLVSIAAMEALRSGSKRDIFSDHEPILRKWYYCKIMQQGAKQATNYKVGVDFQSLATYAKTGVAPEFETVSMPSRKIAELYRGSDVRYRALQSLLAMSIRTDFLTGQPFADDQTEEHHIFPKAFLIRNRHKADMIDSIANKIPIHRTTNGKLSDAPPYEYLLKLKETAERNGTLGQMQQRMSDCLIPGDVMNHNWCEQFKLERFADFIHMRSQLIEQKLRTVIGDSLLEPAAVGFDTDDDD